MSDTEREELQANARVAELETKIHQAAELIGELRESNYSLTGEIAELRREIETLSEGGAARNADAETSAAEGNDGNGAFQAELDALREERKTIREKVALLLERIEKLES